MKNNQWKGHLAAIITVFIWGTTFISTKILLKDFHPIEILLIRFMMGFFALYIAYPKRMGRTTKKQEVFFAMAGLTGVCLYYFLENIALTYTLAANVGIIVSISPFFTAIFTHFFMKKEERLRKRFLLGFVTAMAGISMISFQDSNVSFDPMGDVLSVLAAAVWSCYSILTRKISHFGYHTIQTTRRIFAYGILFMLPAVLLSDFHIQMENVIKPVNFGNLLFLGMGASALCFVTWNFAVKVLGAVRTSSYIYLVPVITVVTSFLVLQEKITILSLTGTMFTLLGLLLSESRK